MFGWAFALSFFRYIDGGGDGGGGKSTSASLKKGRSGRKRGGSQRSHGNNNSSNSYNEDYFNEMPTALGSGGGGTNEVDRINQLMARFAVNGGVGGVQQPTAAYNMFAGYPPKGDDLMDNLLIDGGGGMGHRKGGFGIQSNGSPFGGGDSHQNWNRSSGGSAGLPHPMMMMPGQQNLMTNYFTPSLMTMMKTTPPSSNGHYMNTDFASLPPAISMMSHNPLLLMEEEDAVDGGGGGGGVGVVRGHSLNEKLR